MKINETTINMNEIDLVTYYQTPLIQFDKLKLLLKKEWVYISPNVNWTTEVKHNKCTKKIYKKINAAYKLDITVDDNPSNTHPVTIEFTGKILLDNYPKLITRNTIYDCLQRINKEGVIYIKNFKQVISEALVCQADVTKDIRYSDFTTIADYLQLTMQNNHYSLQTLRNGNVIINKNVGSKSCKQRITIYDKGREMSMARNVAFHTLTYNKLRHTFDGVTRIELNLNTPAQIRNIFQINPGDPVYLYKLLNFPGSILLTLFDQLLVDVQNYVPCDNIKDLRIEAILEMCHNDLKQVRQTLKKVYKSGTNITSKMKEYSSYLAHKKYHTVFTKQQFLKLLK